MFLSEEAVCKSNVLAITMSQANLFVTICSSVVANNIKVSTVCIKCKLQP